LEIIEKQIFDRAYIEALVIAILIGTLIRSLWKPSDRFAKGIHFSGKFLLELAIVLLGFSISFKLLLDAGFLLLVGIVLIVGISIITSYLIGRSLKLPRKMSLLIACGNSICGNSAIAAVAPIIDAHSDDVASAIAFTAILGVAVVLLLPLTAPLLHLSLQQYGILAGLTVYAVPQVLAATAPIGGIAIQIGTLVKLIRVLMLGPVVLVISLFTNFSDKKNQKKISAHHLIPWFIIGFIILTCFRSAGLVNETFLKPITTIANNLTVLAMASLGLGVDIKVLKEVGLRVSLTVTASLAVLIAFAVALIEII
jgi:uncharacterized integral membrane protein (TIGR00698 family)